MNIVLLGSQGSGKGTQARILVEEFGFFYLESGAFFRELAKVNPEIDEQINKKGLLLPDVETVKYLIEYLEKNAPGRDKILFDGFPRTIPQYEMLNNWLGEKGKKLDLAINLIVSREEAIKRLSARREDPKTGKIYNLITDPPGPQVDRSTLVQRGDDRPEAVTRRLDWYESIVLPLIARMKKDTEVIEVDGERPITTIAQDLEKIIWKKQP